MLNQIRTMLEGEFDIEFSSIDPVVINEWKRHPKGRKISKDYRANIVFVGEESLVRVKRSFLDSVKSKADCQSDDIAEEVLGLIDEGKASNESIVFELSKVLTSSIIKPKHFRFLDTSDGDVSFSCFDQQKCVAKASLQEFSLGLVAIVCHVDKEYRNKGLGKYLVLQATKRALVLGLTPVLEVEARNVYGLKIATDLGFSPSFTQLYIK